MSPMRIGHVFNSAVLCFLVCSITQNAQGQWQNVLGSGPGGLDWGSGVIRYATQPEIGRAGGAPIFAPDTNPMIYHELLSAGSGFPLLGSPGNIVQYRAKDVYPDIWAIQPPVGDFGGAVTTILPIINAGRVDFTVNNLGATPRAISTSTSRVQFKFDCLADSSWDMGIEGRIAGLWGNTGGSRYYFAQSITADYTLIHPNGTRETSSFWTLFAAEKIGTQEHAIVIGGIFENGLPVVSSSMSSKLLGSRWGAGAYFDNTVPIDVEAGTRLEIDTTSSLHALDSEIGTKVILQDPQIRGEVIGNGRAFGSDRFIGVRFGVPEPSTWSILGSGLVGFFMCLTRRRRITRGCPS